VRNTNIQSWISNLDYENDPFFTTGSNKIDCNLPCKNSGLGSDLPPGCQGGAVDGICPG
jgi:hypothetical protein